MVGHRAAHKEKAKYSPKVVIIWNVRYGHGVDPYACNNTRQRNSRLHAPHSNLYGISQCSIKRNMEDKSKQDYKSARIYTKRTTCWASESNSRQVLTKYRSKDLRKSTSFL
eukprot:4294902-Amphidinium_carterae.1